MATAAAPIPAPAPASAPMAAVMNVYGEAGADRVQPRLAEEPPRVYVPNSESDTVSVIDPESLQVLDTFVSPGQPQHIVPSYDLNTLWVLGNRAGTLTPLDPATGALGAPVAVEDPYNLYFTPDGTAAIVFAEAHARLDFRDPATMDLLASLEVPECAGLNHGDFSGDGRYLVVTCEFAGRLVKIDVAERAVVAVLDLAAPDAAATAEATVTCTLPSPPTGPTPVAMPQDIRTAPDGRRFYVADMVTGGVHVIDGDSLTAIGFIPTGVGAHGLTPSRDGSRLYVANRGSSTIAGRPRGPGSVSVIDVGQNEVVATWPVPEGGSPDMGNLNADGSQLWLSGRYDGEVYVFDTGTGTLRARIPVGRGPHGLTVWPQPGRYSLGHTGNMR